MAASVEISKSMTMECFFSMAPLRITTCVTRMVVAEQPCASENCRSYRNPKHMRRHGCTPKPEDQQKRKSRNVTLTNFPTEASRNPKAMPRDSGAASISISTRLNAEQSR